jgi:Acyl-protein synthetase, LuxE
MSDDLLARVRAFVGDPGDEDSFAALALAAFAFQYRRIEPYRRFCDGRGATPANVADWRQVPAVPASAFKSVELAAAPAVEVFRSSGTSAGEERRSVHRHPFPDLYRDTVDACFPRYCLEGLSHPSMLSLVPSRAALPDSSLSFMIDHVVAHFGGAGSVWAFGERGLDARAARSWAGARQRDGRPALVLTTALALDRWLEALEKQELRFRLPPGSALFETGGLKGRERALDRGELLARLHERLGVGPERVVGEYGMTELTSQLYTETLLDGDPELFVAPPWVRVRVLDPETLAEAPAGTRGLIAVFDLANLGSAVHLLTEDLGVAPASGSGVRLLGRAAGAELRGCSLAAEELAAAGSARPPASPP